MKIGIDLKGIPFTVDGGTIVFDTEKSILPHKMVQVFNIITVKEDSEKFENCTIKDIGKINISKDGSILLNNSEKKIGKDDAVKVRNLMDKIRTDVDIKEQANSIERLCEMAKSNNKSVSAYVSDSLRVYNYATYY